MRVSRDVDVLREAADTPSQGKHSAALERLRQKALALVRDEDLVDAAYCYDIVPLDEPATELLQVRGEQLFAPWLLPTSGTLTGVACGVCSLGSKLERRVSQLFAERQPSLAMALDALGNQLVFAVSRRAQDHMLADAGRRRLTMAGELRPGDPGLELDAQAAVLRLAQAETIGVSLGEGSLMHPVKSCSMVMGIGIDLPAVQWSRCDHCPTRGKCKVVARNATVAP